MIARPKHTCLNYPRCTGQQHRLRARGASPQWLPHCKSCLDRAVPCSFPDCRNPHAPGSAHLAPSSTSTCAVHYKDPAERHRCTWNLCENSTRVCRELSITIKGRRCFLCASKAYPCLYATEGCPTRVRSQSSKMPPSLPACRTHPARCPYALFSNGICSSLSEYGFTIRYYWHVRSVFLWPGASPLHFFTVVPSCCRPRLDASVKCFVLRVVPRLYFCRHHVHIDVSSRGLVIRVVPRLHFGCHHVYIDVSRPYHSVLSSIRK